MIPLFTEEDVELVVELRHGGPVVARVAVPDLLVANPAHAVGARVQEPEVAGGPVWTTATKFLNMPAPGRPLVLALKACWFSLHAFTAPVFVVAYHSVSPAGPEVWPRWKTKRNDGPATSTGPRLLDSDGSMGELDSTTSYRRS